MFQQAFYPHQSNQQAFLNHRTPTNHFMQPRSMFFRSNGQILNQSTNNLHFTRDFERFPMSNHGFTSIQPGRNPVFDINAINFEQQQRWRQAMAQARQQKHRRTPAFLFQDKSTSYYMTDPILTSDNRITIQLTKVRIGPNGDQQRVFVEQEFSNEKELHKFVRNLRQNFENTFNNHRTSNQNSNTDDSNSADTKKPGVVVVEEPDEEPKIYQQQAYNANIESKVAAASLITPPMSPTSDYMPHVQDEIRSRPASPQQRRTKHVSPMASQLSSTSTTRSSRRRKNKMKYRRQKVDHRQEPKSSRTFPIPSFSRQYQTAPTPPRLPQRPFVRDTNCHIKSPLHIPPNPNFPWKYNPNGFPKTRSRSFIPTMNEHFQNKIDPFFRTNFTQHRSKESHLLSSPTKINRTHRRQSNQPTTIAENIVYSPNEQQKMRVQSTKSESQQVEKQQQHRSRSTTNQFPNFSPLRQVPIIQRHFTPFRAPPLIFPTVNSTTPIFYPNQRRQCGNIQTQLRLINPFHLSTNRF